MEEYSFWRDLLHSYRESPDIIKALWVLAPPGFVLGLVAVLRLTRRPPPPAEDDFVCTITRESDGVVRLRRQLPPPELSKVEYDEERAAEPSGRSPSR